MANVSPPRRAFQPTPTLAPKTTDRLAVPKYDVVDPLLGNLSPESTLQALSSTDAVPKNERAAHDILSKSIYQASPTERALGIRAAVAAQKLGQWYREVHKWSWPKRSHAQLGKGFVPPSDADDTIYYGSLPAAVVEEHESRIEEIREGMDNLDVEELKEHVLNAHIPGRSRPSSANSTMSVPPPLSYVQLSDFTAVITATILRALPLLSRLNALLSNWDVRLLVVRQIPGLLRSLKLARSELTSASDLLKSLVPPTEKDVLYSMANYHAKRAALESTVLSAGRRIDRILDSLDGREDSLPEIWIDDLEAIEADFASWVMQAEKRTVENEWRRLSARSIENTKPEPDNTQPTLPEISVSEPSPVETPPAELESPSREPPEQAERNVVPEPSQQHRPVPLQVGLAHPMETIVEEMGSPFDRSPARITGNIIDPAVTRATPESPSPMPADATKTEETLGQVPTMQLDTSRRTIDWSSAAEKVENEESILQSPAEKPPIEEPVQLEGSDHELPIDSSVEVPAGSDEPRTDVKVVDSTSLSPVVASPADSLPSLQNPNDEMSPSSDEPEIDIKLEEDTIQSPLNAPPTESVLPSIEAPDDEFPRATMKPELQTSLHGPSREVQVETPVAQPVDIFEEPLHSLQALENGQPADIAPESPTGSHKNEDLPPITQPIEESASSNLKSTVEPDTIKAEPPSDEPMQIESVPEKVESTVQLSRDEHHPQAQPSQPKIDNKPQPSTSLPTHPTKKTPLTNNKASASALDELSKVRKNLKPVSKVDAGRKFSPPEKQAHPLSDRAAFSPSAKEAKPITDGSQSVPESSERTTGEDAAIEVAPAEAHTPESRKRTTPERCSTPPGDNMASLANLFVPHDSCKAPEQTREPEPEENNTLKKPLDSPIKLSRPGRLGFKDNSNSRVRRTSNGSEGSLSDFPSLVSSQEMPERRNSSSNGTPLLLETPPHFPKDYRPTASTRQSDHTLLREDRLLHLDAQKPSPRDISAHNRTLSLPLQRFINESFDVNYDTSGTEDVFAEPSGHKKGPAERRRKSKSATPSDIVRSKAQRPALKRENSSGPESEASNDRKSKAQNQKGKTAKSTLKTSTSVEPVNNAAAARLKQNLTTHRSLESIGPYKSNAKTGDSKVLPENKSRASSLSKPLLRAKDQMDEKINTILTSLPGHIHLVQADQDDDAISIASSVPFRRERLWSDSPQGTPSRAFTPTPSLTLRPAITRRRHSHAPEESSVKLYHLHRGGKSAPTKLFVRTVGESGERVMVRVGGGWADLAEYLREYAIHHGRRHVSETPRVEVEGITPRESPSYSPPSSRVPSGSARQMPARPGSVLSNRPASSLAVRKTRRSSNVSDFGDHRIASAGDGLNISFSPMPGTMSDRRMSVSSNVSAGAMSSVSELRHGSPGAPTVPLGLAGPKPRAKHSAITPEGEAWVEDVLGQARRSSSLRPFKYILPSPEQDAEGNTPTLPKSRSISDIGKAGSSKRVVLRNLR